VDLCVFPPGHCVYSYELNGIPAEVMQVHEVFLTFTPPNQSRMRKHIPNTITLLNLAFGSIALYMVFSGKPVTALIMLLAASLCDFLDGMTAKLLHVVSDIGKQLDSLSDLVSFGLVPAAMVFTILQQAMTGHSPGNVITFIVLVSVVLIPVMAAIRLARFNLQEDTGVFFGLPVPAFALFWTGIYFDYSQTGMLFNFEVQWWYIVSLMILLSLFMVLHVPMMTLKFQGLGMKKNYLRYILLGISAILLITTGIPGLSLAILVYILLSLFRIILT